MTNLAMFLIGFLGLSVLLTLYSVLRPVCVRILYEGFENAPTPQVEALRTILARVNRVGRSLADPELWSYRIGLLGKSPMDLARMQLKSQTPSE
jgi:hypothetical protein